MSHLKSYLEEGGGVQLAGTPQLTQYFGLPYAQDPLHHPLFKELLQVCYFNSNINRTVKKKWVSNLHDHVSKVLNNYGRLPEIDAEEEPKLALWLKAYERQQEPQAANRENVKGAFITI